jgi:hypothetical protein
MIPRAFCCLQATPFYQPANNGSRRLLRSVESELRPWGDVRGARRMLTGATAPSDAMGDVLDAVIQFTVSLG